MTLSSNLNDIENIYASASRLANAISTATGFIDLKDKLNPEKSSVGQGIKEVLSVAAIAVNTALSPVMDSGLKAFDGTKVAQLELDLTDKFQKIIEQGGPTATVLQGLANAYQTTGKLNQAKNTFIQSPIASAAMNVALPLVMGAPLGPIGIGVGAAVVAVNTVVGAKQINDINVVSDEFAHLQDYHHSKMVQSQNIKQLSIESGLKPKEISQMIGVSYNPASSKLTPESETKNTNKITTAEVTNVFMQSLASNIAETASLNILSTGSAMVQGPHAVAVSLARMAITTFAGTSAELTNRQAKELIHNKIVELRKDGPEYKTQQDNLTNTQLFANKLIKRKITINPELPAVSRKYDLANIAMNEKLNADTLDRLKDNQEFLTSLKECKTYKEDVIGKDIAKINVTNKFLEVKGDVLEDVKKNNPLYQYEQIQAPTTKVGKVIKNSRTVASTSGQYLIHGTQTYAGAYESIQEKLQVYEKDKNARIEIHKNLLDNKKAEIAGIERIKNEKITAEKSVVEANKENKNGAIEKQKDEALAPREVKEKTVLESEKTKITLEKQRTEALATREAKERIAREAKEKTALENEKTEKQRAEALAAREAKEKIAREEKEKSALEKEKAKVVLETKRAEALAAKTTKDKDIVQPKAEDLTKTTTSVATLVEKTPVSAANVHPVDKNVVEAISIDYNNKRAIDSLVKMIDGQVDKAKILGHINKNCNSESLKIPVKLEARDVSILEYTISKNAGSKVVGAILTKGNFTTEEIKKAQTRIVDGSTKRSRIANTKKVLNAHSIQAALQHSSSSVVSNKASPPASHALHNIQTTQTR